MRDHEPGFPPRLLHVKCQEWDRAWGLGRLASVSPVIGTALQLSACLRFQMQVQWIALGQALPGKAFNYRSCSGFVPHESLLASHLDEQPPIGSEQRLGTLRRFL